MALLKAVAALAVVIGIVALVLKLATAPLYAVYDAHDCLKAYGRARSLADTVRVDLHPLASEHARRTCGETRAVSVSNPSDIAALRH